MLALATRSKFYIARSRRHPDDSDNPQRSAAASVNIASNRRMMADAVRSIAAPSVRSAARWMFAATISVRKGRGYGDQVELGNTTTPAARALIGASGPALCPLSGAGAAVPPASAPPCWRIVYVQMTSGGGDGPAIAAALHNVFYASVIFIAIAVWPFILASDASRAARQETNHQTTMLMAEIEAHRRTDLQSQQAQRELADARNVAKSKYARGMSHELRDAAERRAGLAPSYWRMITPPPRGLRHSVRVIRRSGDHLASLVDGLLDISMIEAGRLLVMKEEVQLPSFLEPARGHDAAAGARCRAGLHLLHTHQPAGQRLYRRKAAAPDLDQPALQCHPIYRRGQRHAAHIL